MAMVSRSISRTALEETVEVKRRPMVTGADQRRVIRLLNLIYEKAGVGPFARGAGQ